MADYGIKAAKAGSDVFSSDPRDFNLWSKYKVLKVDLNGGGTITVLAGNTDTVTINHNLGYNPMILLFWGIASANNKKIGRGIIAVATDAVYIQNDASDLDNVVLYFYASAAGNKTFDYYYYLLYDEGINA